MGHSPCYRTCKLQQAHTASHSEVAVWGKNRQRTESASGLAPARPME